MTEDNALNSPFRKPTGDRLVPRDVVRGSARGDAFGVPTAGPAAHPLPGPDALKELTDTRRGSHGDYRKGAAFTQDVMRRVSATTNWQTMPATQRESVHMIVHKLQRILEGDNTVADHWDDIGGYSKLESRILKKEY